MEELENDAVPEDEFEALDDEVDWDDDDDDDWDNDQYDYDDYEHDNNNGL